MLYKTRDKGSWTKVLWRHCFTETRLEYSENIAKDVLGKAPLLNLCQCSTMCIFHHFSPEHRHSKLRAVCAISQRRVLNCWVSSYTPLLTVSVSFVFLNLFGGGPRCCFEAWRIAHAHRQGVQLFKSALQLGQVRATQDKELPNNILQL